MAINLSSDRLSAAQRLWAETLVYGGMPARNERMHMAAQLNVLATALAGAERVQAIQELNAYRLLAHLKINVTGVQLKKHPGVEHGSVVVQPEFIATVAEEELFGGTEQTLPSAIGGVRVMYECPRRKRLFPGHAPAMDGLRVGGR